MNEREVKAEVWMPLTKGKVTVIDFDDFEKVRDMKWSAKVIRGDIWYVQGASLTAAGTKTTISIHRFLTKARPGELVDHKDGDGLNNRRDNLRIATRAQNAQNSVKAKGGSSQFKGVSRYKPTNKWRAGICVNSKRIFLGYFHSEEEAARAYDVAALQYFGEFARINSTTL